MEKEIETKDEHNKLDKKEIQPAVDNRIEDSSANKEKQMTIKNSETQDVPCNIEGVLVHVQLLHIICLYLLVFRVLCRCTCR